MMQDWKQVGSEWKHQNGRGLVKSTGVDKTGAAHWHAMLDGQVVGTFADLYNSRLAEQFAMGCVERAIQRTVTQDTPSLADTQDL
jgi:hypothetical protein